MRASAASSAASYEKDDDRRDDNEHQDFALTQEYAEHSRFVSLSARPRLAGVHFLNVALDPDTYGDFWPKKQANSLPGECFLTGIELIWHRKAVFLRLNRVTGRHYQ